LITPTLYLRLRHFRHDCRQAAITPTLAADLIAFTLFFIFAIDFHYA